MTSRLFFFGAALYLPVLLAQAGCGSGSQGKPATGETPTAPQGGALAQGAPEGGAEGGVTVGPTANRFEAGQNLTLAVSNGLAQTVYVEDMKTDCSIVTLLAKAGDGWETVWGCGMERLPRVVAIEPGGSEPVVIQPDSSHILNQGGLGAGTYRARFSYRLAPGPEGEEPEVAFSAEFEIGS